MRNTYFFILTSFIFFFNSTFANSNDYMSTELHKAIDIECKQAVKKNLYNSKDECESSLIESLNKVGIVSVTRVNDEEVQEEVTNLIDDLRAGSVQLDDLSDEQKDQIRKALSRENVLGK